MPPNGIKDLFKVLRTYVFQIAELIREVSSLFLTARQNVRLSLAQKNNGQKGMNLKHRPIVSCSAYLQHYRIHLNSQTAQLLNVS